ncbi:hypothetical protein [Shewanella gelidii]|nr:hypothetical protein [Shewanella gelidii]MCL1099717.1 hypothetical protein [Shewanella gelidii]
MFSDFNIQLTTFDWNGVSGITNILMVVLTGLLLYGLKQGSNNIKESALSRDADILRWAMSEMDKLKPDIRLITDAHKKHNYCNCPNAHQKIHECNWDIEELAAAQRVSITMQRIGYMALHNLISRNHFTNLWGPMYLSTWYALEAWVKHKRLDLDEPLSIKEGAYSRMYLEQFAIYCEEMLPLELVNNERERFNLPMLTQNDRKSYQKLVDKLGARKEKLDI